MERVRSALIGLVLVGLSSAGCSATGSAKPGSGTKDSGTDANAEAEAGTDAAACTPGQTTCNGNAVATCGADGTWGAPSPCDGGTCSGGTCVTLGDTGTDSGSKLWTEYWLLGQLPDQTTVYVYARNGANITFGGTISSPKTVTVPPDTFTPLNAGTLGYAATGTQWYFLEATGDADFMMSGDRVVNIPGWTTFHGDELHDKPGHGLSTSYTFAYAQSGPADDKAVMYAPQQTTVTIHAYSNTGQVGSQQVSINGLYTSDYISSWLSISDGYGLTITADKPIAAALFDEINDSTHPTSGYFFGWLGQTQLYDEYMHIHYASVDTSAYHSLYVPQADSLTYYLMGGAQLTTKTYTGETSEIVYHQPLGYDITQVPYLVHYKATQGVADSYVTPTSTDVTAGAAYMGWNASLAQLEIYAASAASVEVYDGRNHALRGTFSVPAGTIFTKALTATGLAADTPFVVAVKSDVPVYQEVRMSNGVDYNSADFLRQYPQYIGPVIQ